MLPEELYGFLDYYADTSLCRFAGICIVSLYSRLVQRGTGHQSFRQSVTTENSHRGRLRAGIFYASGYIADESRPIMFQGKLLSYRKSKSLSAPVRITQKESVLGCRRDLKKTRKNKQRPAFPQAFSGLAPRGGFESSTRWHYWTWADMCNDR